MRKRRRRRSDRDKPSILALFGGQRKDAVEKDPSACDAYRVIFPFSELNRHGYHANWMPLEMAFRMYDEGRLSPDEYDIFLLPRHIYPIGGLTNIMNFVTELHERGKKVVVEWDDDYTNVHRDVTDGNDAVTALMLADAAIVSTPGLAEVVGNYNRNVYVAPNCIVPEMFDRFREEKYRRNGRLTVGVMGSKTHVEDWRPAIEALKVVCQLHSNVLYFVGGLLPSYLEGVNNLVISEWTPFMMYPSLCRQIDIGLAPLDPLDGFNASKSAVKALEYMASKRTVNGAFGGAAVVCTDHPVYRRVVKHNKSIGMLVRNHKDVQEWVDVICTLIEDDRLRHRLQTQGHKWVMRNRTYKRGWLAWARAFDSIWGG